MTTEPTDERKTPDFELNAALEAHVVEELDELSIQHQRLARIQEYEEAAILRPDPFAAVIGMGNAHLQRVFEHLGAAVLEEMDSRAHTLDELREFEPEIRLLVRLRKSIETDLVVQPPDSAQWAAALPPSKKGKGIDTKAAVSTQNLVPKHWGRKP